MSAKRRRPLNVPLIDEAEPSSGPAHRSWGGVLGAPEEQMVFRLHDVLIGLEQVRMDDLQMFVGMGDEDEFVAGFHFPEAGGIARQIKIVADLFEFIRERDNNQYFERVFDGQLLIDFEQLVVNFVVASLPALRASASLLSKLNPHRIVTEPVTRDSSMPTRRPADGKEDYIVNVSSGWPRDRPRFRVHEIVRLDPGGVQRDVDSGFLVRAKDAEQNKDGWGAEYVPIIEAHRAALATAQKRHRPAPTDVEAVLATGEGRKVREQIVDLFAKVVDQMFPSSPGRPHARTAAEEKALADEIRADFNKRKAAYVGKGISKTRRAIFDEMAEESRYGPYQQSIGASSIERLMKRSTGGRQRK